MTLDLLVEPAWLVACSLVGRFLSVERIWKMRETRRHPLPSTKMTLGGPMCGTLDIGRCWEVRQLP